MSTLDAYGPEELPAIVCKHFGIDPALLTRPHCRVRDKARAVAALAALADKRGLSMAEASTAWGIPMMTLRAALKRFQQTAVRGGDKRLCAWKRSVGGVR